MKKNILVFGCVISCLILVSLSYQPIIAEKPLIKSREKIISIESEDCGCNNQGNIWPFPIICSLLYLMYKFVYEFHLWPIGLPPLLLPIFIIAQLFGCSWTNS